MLFQNIDFHNVDKLFKTKSGYKMQRVDDTVLPHLSDVAKREVAYFGTGVELRFVMEGHAAEITLCIDKADFGLTSAPTVSRINVFYGDYQSGWQTPDYPLVPGRNVIRLCAPQGIKDLQKLHHQTGGGFSPQVVRLCLQQTVVEFVCASGDIRPPRADECPAKTILFYGSSITNGADAQTVAATFPFRTAQHFNMDYLNLGFSGNAMLEKEMAQYICKRNDWDYACIELGANVYGYSESEFTDHVKAFIETMAADGRPVFCTDLFGCRSDLFGCAQKTEWMRSVVKAQAEKSGVFYVPGLTLLPANAMYVTTDGVHPSVVGANVLAQNYQLYFQKFLESISCGG